MERITKKQVKGIFELVCMDLGIPFKEVWRQKDGKNTAIIGAWYLDYNPVYGGYVINEMVNEAGGVTCPLGYNRMPTREFYNFLHGINNGLIHGVFKAKH